MPTNHASAPEPEPIQQPETVGSPPETSAREAELIPLRDPQSLSEFMAQPRIKIAEAITSALSLGRSDVTLIAGRLIQGALKGNLLTQIAREIRHLIEKGGIREDYAETKFGFKSLVELLAFIDDEVPDEDRLNAVKAMFIAINSVDAKEGQEILNYQLLQVSKRLSASQLATLKSCYDLYKEKAFDAPGMVSARQWLETLAKRLGHGVLALVEQDESVLIEMGLVTPRIYPDKSGISVICLNRSLALQNQLVQMDHGSTSCDDS